MTDGSKTLLGAGVVAVVLAIAAFQMFRGTGPMDLGQAMRLAQYKLGAGIDSVETIAPDGEKAVAPSKVLKAVRVIGCPKIGGRAGSLAGRYGQGSRTHATAAFECLLEGKSRSGTVLHFAGHVWRSADPSYRGELNGHMMSFLRADRVLALMRTHAIGTRPYAGAEQAALRDALAGDEIYVPADKSRPSPIEKAMQNHLKRISSD